MEEAKQDYIAIFAHGITVMARIGLLPQEKAAAQRLIVHVKLYADPQTYLADAQNGAIIDYANIVAFVQRWEKRPHVELLETYAQELLDFCFATQGVEAAKITLTKPDIFENAQAGVEVFKRR